MVTLKKKRKRKRQRKNWRIVKFLGPLSGDGGYQRWRRIRNIWLEIWKEYWFHCPSLLLPRKPPRFIGFNNRRNEAALAVNTSRSRLLEVLAISSSTWQPRSTQKAQPAANQSRKLQDTAVRKNAQSKIICIFFGVLPVLMQTLADVSVRYNASF